MKVRFFGRSGSVVVIVMLGLFMGSEAAAQSKSSGQLVATSAKASQLPPIYQRWLNEDVVYIITPQEETAFLKLSTGAERDKFVEQFWLRRDPTPDTEENEYKEEHYRRIAFANVHFAESSPGWKTDRGRTYIVYGPPDEIKTETVRLVNGTSLPTMEWHYRSVSGHPIDFQFVDGCDCGQYQLLLTPTPH